MTKLVNKFGIGGIAETVDASLDILGPYGKLGVQILDPTGITGWKDLGEAFTNFLKKGTFLSAGELGLAALGAMPMIGSLGKLGKSKKLIPKSSKVFDPSTYKLLINSSESVTKNLAKNFSPEMKKLAVKILDNEIIKIVDWCKALNIKKVPKELESKIISFADKLSNIIGENVNISKLMDNINLELGRG